MVIVGSKHLMLPAIYCNLQRKSLLKHLPTELRQYLEELTSINRARNQCLLKEVQHISGLFQQHGIDHVFLKGTGMLAGGHYHDIGERMIGDIDILVDQDQLDNAFNILESDGYDQLIKFNYQTKNYRHKPRQINSTKLGAVELHEKVLKHGHQFLIDEKDLLSQKTIVNGVTVPSAEHLIKGAIYALQVNDRATFFGSLHLKGAYDALSARLHENDPLIQELSRSKHGSSFLGISSVFFKNLNPKPETFWSKLSEKSYLFRLKHPKLGAILYKTKSLYINLYDRTVLILTNKSYRTHILNHKILKKEL